MKPQDLDTARQLKAALDAVSADPEKHLATSAKGRITAAALKFDKLGRPYIDAKVELDHIDSLTTLLRQCQALEIAFSFTTKTALPELFE